MSGTSAPSAVVTLADEAAAARIAGDAATGEDVAAAAGRAYVHRPAIREVDRQAVLALLPPEETERRWKETTSQWPIMHAVTYGVSRDQMMARHKANHIQVVYAPSAQTADKALAAKAAMFAALGIAVHLCGDVRVA